MIKVSDPSVEDILYMIDEQSQESSVKLYTFLCVLQITAACRGFAIRANHAERTREPS